MVLEAQPWEEIPKFPILSPPDDSGDSRVRSIFAAVYPQIRDRYPRLDPDYLAQTLWHLWLPLALQLVRDRTSLQRPLIQGILGGQGTGKSTLAAILKLILTGLGYPTLNLSLDDLYKTYAERQQLRQADPRLIWRGPPGTHDLALGIAVLDRLRNAETEIAIPRFDKSAYGGEGDRTQPEIVSQIEIILFEGWFVGVKPIDPIAFDNPPSPIHTESDRAFAREMNAKLADYLPLWQRLDRLWILYPSDHRLSKQWRHQAEQDAISQGRSGMSDRDLEQFVEYFWRSLHPELFIQPLTQQPDWVNLVIEIDRDRTITQVYSPKEC